MKQIIFKKIIFSGSIIFLLFLSVSNVKAQDNIPAFKKNEIWVNFFSPGVDYKRAINRNTFLRMGINFSINIGKTDFQNNRENQSSYNSYNNGQNTNGYGYLSLGIEKRKHLSEKVSVFYGPNIFLGYSKWDNDQYYYINHYSNGNFSHTSISQNKTTNLRYSGGAGFTLGAMYHFNNFLGLGVNWSPNINFSLTENNSNMMENNSNSGYSSSSESSSSTRKDHDVGLSLSTPSVKVLIRF